MEIKKLKTENEIRQRVKEVAEKIQEDYKNEEIVFVCVLKGALFFFADLLREISLQTKIDFVKISSYDGTESTGNINFSLDVSSDLNDKNVIIVEDIVDTGRTLFFLKNYMLSKNPKSLKICTMLDKKERRIEEIVPDYVCFEIPNKFVVGYGLDYDDKYRNLPYIGYIE